MRILGVDPGLGITGYGIIDAKNGNLKLVEAGVIRPNRKEDISIRLFNIYSELTELIQEHKPQVLVLEKLYSHYKHPTTAMLMGHARGVACLAAGENSLKLINHSATRVKKALTGNGHASKEQIQRMVAHTLKFSKLPRLSDVTDALALALAYVYIGEHD